MSKYTTEVRFICESKSGLEESSGANSVDDILANSWNKIFTTKAPFFDESYRPVLCQKILKHYYLREICSETVGIWILWMNERLESIMPYYNQLYNSELLKYDPLNDTDVTIKRDRDVTGNENNERAIKDSTIINNTSNSTSTIDQTTTTGSSENYSDNTTRRDLYSDTPQGAITGLENETYLTNARKITDGFTHEGESNTTTKVNGTNTFNGTNETNDTKTSKNTYEGINTTKEDYTENISGKQGSGSYSKLLLEYRQTFINIDMMVINEFQDLFFGLW